MAKPYVTGPAHHFVGLGSPGAPAVYLGTSKRSPSIRLLPEYVDYFNSIAGVNKPMDKGFDGEDAIVISVLNRYNESVYAAMAARPKVGSTNTSVRGTNVPGDIGTLMVAEGFAYQLWLQFPYSAKPAYSDMPAGYRFLAAMLLGPDDLTELNTNPRELILVWYCARAYEISSSTQAGGGLLLKCYDHNMSGLPAIN